MNFTTGCIQGSNEHTLELDYVTFECPKGYVFEGSTIVKHYAICYNWSYIYTFNESAICARKFFSNFKISAAKLKLHPTKKIQIFF